MKNNILLLIIDPQNDFTDKRGSLYVKDAELAIQKICKFIRTNGDTIDRILISQDTHQKYNIGFPRFWKIKDLKPFDKINVSDILSEKVVPNYIDPNRKDGFLSQFRNYRDKELTVWPYHCIEGTWGWCFPDELNDALGEWSLSNHRRYYVYRKGYIPEIESYSIFPSVACIGDDRTQRPSEIFNYHNIYVAGFCKDICVAETIYDMRKFSNRFILLDNCMATLDSNSPKLEIYKNLPGAKFENV